MKQRLRYWKQLSLSNFYWALWRLTGNVRFGLIAGYLDPQLQEEERQITADWDRITMECWPE